MEPADFYALARRDRARATRALLCYDARGLWRLATACAEYLFAHYGVHIAPDHVLTIWQRTALVGTPHVDAALQHREHMVGE